jgi:hypothetical protein
MVTTRRCHSLLRRFVYFRFEVRVSAERTVASYTRIHCGHLPSPGSELIVKISMFFCVFTPCGLVARWKRFVETYCLHLQG